MYHKTLHDLAPTLPLFQSHPVPSSLLSPHAQHTVLVDIPHSQISSCLRAFAHLPVLSLEYFPYFFSWITLISLTCLQFNPELNQ